jgi:tetratricopeptide (TPR) repeat protein
MSPSAPPFDFDAFVTWCAEEVAAGVDYDTYDTAFRRVADELFPSPPAGELRDDPALRRRVARCMARAIWRQAPHPAHRFGPAPLPLPERNAPCHCGSLRKYKQCCQSIERDVPIQQLNLLPFVLEALPKKRWGELVGSRVGAEMLAHAAHEWIDEGKLQHAQALLEPWFAGDAHFVARHEMLFDLLLDVYTLLDKPRKKADLLDRGLRHGDRTLRSASMQRRVSMLADAGDFAAAWKLFSEAQRHQPDSPSLSHLEVTLLLSEGREAEARERARFWLLQLERKRDPELADLIGLLREVANQGGDAMLALAARDDPEFSAFIEAWRAVPPITVHYRLQAVGDSAGPLEATRELRDALRRWEAVFPAPAHSPLQDALDDPWEAVPNWLPLLRSEPSLWSAFEVLDALQDAVADIAVIGAEGLRTALLDRGERLLREVIRAHGAGGLKLEWTWHENRVALGLLGNRIDGESSQASTPEHLARLEWLVCELNPDDNQGLRDLLLRRYFELDRHADALALVERYPDDLAAMRYGRALALHALDKPGASLGALREAVQAFPRTLDWLLKATAKPPRPGRHGIEVGGDEEAWLYREEWLPLWQRLGALDWARRYARSR